MRDVVVESFKVEGCSAARRKAQKARPVVPVMLKGVCRGDCPELHGKRVSLVDNAWRTMGNATVYVEETSGWLALWWDAGWTVPLVPRVDEAKAVKHGDEEGYLKQPRAGRLLF